MIESALRWPGKPRTMPITSWVATRATSHREVGLGLKGVMVPFTVLFPPGSFLFHVAMAEDSSSQGEGCQRRGGEALTGLTTQCICITFGVFIVSGEIHGCHPGS